MDWKLEQQRREKNQHVGKKESALSVNILGEMERGFAQIFGEAGNAGFTRSQGQAGDPVRRSESSRQCKEAKAE